MAPKTRASPFSPSGCVCAGDLVRELWVYVSNDHSLQKEARAAYRFFGPRVRDGDRKVHGRSNLAQRPHLEGASVDDEVTLHLTLRFRQMSQAWVANSARVVMATLILNSRRPKEKYWKVGWLDIAGCQRLVDCTVLLVCLRHDSQHKMSVSVLVM